MTVTTRMAPGADDATALDSRRPTVGNGRMWDTALITVAAVLLLVLGGLAGLLWAPEDAIQKAPQRIFYIHVPTAWVGFLAFFVVFVASIGYLMRGSARMDTIARSSAEVGLLFTTLALITGALWGKPIWGVWWQWDVRLTTALILELTFIAYLLLRRYGGPGSEKLSAGLALFGMANVPFVYVSVNFWRTIHPETTVITTLAPSMGVPFWWCVAAYFALFLVMLDGRRRLEEQRAAVDRLRLAYDDD